MSRASASESAPARAIHRLLTQCPQCPRTQGILNRARDPHGQPVPVTVSLESLVITTDPGLALLQLNDEGAPALAEHFDGGQIDYSP